MDPADRLNGSSMARVTLIILAGYRIQRSHDPVVCILCGCADRKNLDLLSTS